ncbi:xanthine dehydrogenase family protein molybdopterin-binding subunit [Gordonia sp. C13]|uniref:xanthine dehydrogenase family protein molybdopterin-binding subunit n=1 Tax=Gordonia sp. C13 TaxID=2935078 RepID=UPI00200B7F90|nr:xanthine dehydrogenase family protein molybdopterin-binding subunit [Gordonia sp. C13]MCK8615319.1 xanthine dehydrogenase family protein molybdopterin-binding subunit [Gordonia sp. C13]
MTIAHSPEVNPSGRVIGVSSGRSDGVEKVTGQAVYTMDFEEVGTLVGMVLRSDVARGRVIKLNIEPAQRIPGVRAVATHVDIPHLSGMSVVKDQPTFASDMVRYVGEPLAAVAADTADVARRALAAIEVEIEKLPAVISMEEAIAPDAPDVHADWQSYEIAMEADYRGGNIVWQNGISRGSDAEFARAFETADAIVEDFFRVPRQNQTPIEPHVSIASYRNGRYVVHTSTQFPYMIRERTAELLNIPPSQVRVVVPTVGGGFGGKLDAILEPIACVLARKSRRPVKILNTREEEFATTGCRENATVSLRTAVSSDGRILAQSADVRSDNGAYSSGETVVCAGIATLALGCTYRIPLARYTSKVIYTNTPPTAAFRGVNGPYCVFAVENHIEHIARTIGMDRREFRLRNVLRKGDAMVNGQILDDACLVEALESVERRATWTSSQSPCPPGKLRGKALVPLSWLTNAGPSEASVHLTEDGSIMVMSAATEIGTGAVTTGIRQIVAEALGTTVDQVRISAPDTDGGGFDNGAQGSRTTFGAGAASKRAALVVREQILRAAAEMLDCSLDAIELSGGRAVSDTGTSVSFEQISRGSLWKTGPISGTGSFVASPAKYAEATVTGAMVTGLVGVSYHAHYAEVEVDTATGTVEILRYVVAQDVGRAINPAMIRGQVRGAVTQGVGYALFEEVRVDQSGHVLDTGFESYRVPTAWDIPAIDLEILESPSAEGPFGAKGVAEPPIVPVAAVLCAAVSDAIGQAITELPVTPFRVLEAILAAGQGD